LCKRFNFDKFNLLRQFKQYTGLSPINYLIALRIQKAKELMISTDLPLVQIALESGFYDQSHFSNCFVKLVGLTPGEYRRRIAQHLDR
jgi:transcriptional regulator GlxA family with amidase domain